MKPLSLRQWLTLSHVLLLIGVTVLVGYALLYVVETRVVRVNFTNEMVSEAVLVAELARNEPDIWSDPLLAERFVIRLAPLFPSQLMLLDTTGVVLASSDPNDEGFLGRRRELIGFEDVVAGGRYVGPQFNPTLQAEVTDVMVPVTGPDGEIAGVVRLTDQFGALIERFLRLRSVVVAVLTVGVIAGIIAGAGLASAIQNPVRQVTVAAERLSLGHHLERLPEQGPDEVRRLSHAFNLLVERLLHLEEGRRRLLANLVHELSRPITSLSAATTALAQGAADILDLREELLSGMQSELDRLRRLLDDLTGLEEQVLGSLQVERRPTELSHWLAQTVAPWREAAQQKGLHWESAIPRNLPVVAIDAVRLGQVLGNLLSNAIKYTPPGGKVCVSAGMKEGELCIHVEDSGIGIPPEEQERIFEPLYRSATGRTFNQGMGLGLTIARDLILAHAGQLELESAPAEGSRFTVRLPAMSLTQTPHS